MLLRLLPLCLAAALFFACKKSEIQSPLPVTRTETVLLRYAGGIPAFSPMPNPFLEEMKYKFEFTGQAVTARFGNFIPIFTPSPGSVFSNGVFDSVEYLKDTIVVSKQTSLASVILPPDVRKFVIRKGRLHMRIRYAQAAIHNDTTWFYFGPKGKLARTEKRFQNVRILTDFTYNTKGNVKYVITDEYLGSEQTGHAETMFTEYDDKINPIKGLLFWEELLERTMSENNPLKGHFVSMRYSNGSIVRTGGNFNFTYHYDAQGRADLSK